MSAVKANAPIDAPGAVGYLLWLRRDLPRTYLRVMTTVPAVAQFEKALRAGSTLGCCGMGDDAIDLTPVSIDTSDFSSAASAFDTSSLDTSAFPGGADASILDPITVTSSYDAGSAVSDPSGSLSISDASIVSPSIPQLPPIAPPSPSLLSSLGSAASALGSGIISSLPAVASIVKAAAPIAIAAIQTKAALAGVPPIRTGYFVNPSTGQPYLAGVAGPSPFVSSFSPSIGGFPLWALALAGVGVVVLVSRS